MLWYVAVVVVVLVLGWGLRWQFWRWLLLPVPPCLLMSAMLILKINDEHDEG